MALLFDTHVQKMKYNVLREVAKLAYSDELTSAKLMEVSKTIIPDGKPMFRCCIYKERAIINERVGMALGGEEDGTVVSVLPIACDECPVDGIQVSAACRGCLAHRCMDNCPKGAISIVNHRAVIDKEKCVECGRCMAVCPYSAIVKHTRPCVSACKPKAIHIDPETQKAVINKEKCISCGACVYQCPFGAITDKSSITQVISLIRNSHDNKEYHVYAVVAPSMASQYPNAVPEQVVAGIRRLGFHAVVEAAWGADMVAWLEAQELAEKGFLTSSCCPAFVSYIEKNFPSLVPNISHNLSPMAQIAKYSLGHALPKRPKRNTRRQRSSWIIPSPLRRCRPCSLHAGSTLQKWKKPSSITPLSSGASLRAAAALRPQWSRRSASRASRRRNLRLRPLPATALQNAAQRC